MDLLSEWIRKNYDLLKLKESVVLNEKRNPILRLLFQIPNEKSELHPLGDKKKSKNTDSLDPMDKLIFIS